MKKKITHILPLLGILVVLLTALTSQSVAEKYSVKNTRYGTVKGTGKTAVELWIQTKEQSGKSRKALRISLISGEVAPSADAVVSKKQMQDLYEVCKKARAGSPGAQPFLKTGSVRSKPPLLVGTTSKGAIAFQCSNPMIGVGTVTVVLGKNGYQEFMTMLQAAEKKL